MFGIKNKYQSRIEELESKELEYLAQIKNLQDIKGDYEKTISAYPMAKIDMEDSLSKQKAQYEGKIKELQAKLDETESSLFRRVNRELAKVGLNSRFALENEMVKSSDNKSTPKSIYDKFMALEGKPEQATFFKTHEMEISRYRQESVS